MFYIKYKGHTVVYSGDFNSLSDRHLGAAYIDRLEPDLLISESTYATTIRDTKRTRERNFLMHVPRSYPVFRSKRRSMQEERY
jgi:integrator complex subunit 11